jgi:hypothetical protein
MTAQTLLDELAACGVTVRAVGPNLRLGPKAAVTPEITETVRWHKPGLLALLRPFPPERLALLAVAGDLAEAINAHLAACRVCRMEFYVADAPAPLCPDGLELWGLYRMVRLAALGDELSASTALPKEVEQ